MESESGSGSNSGQTVQLVYVDENGKLKTDPEAISTLQKLKGPIAVVSLIGKSLHGKSFIWNQLLSKSIGFEVQSLHRPCIGDIWLWIEPFKRISQDGTEYTLVLLDIEIEEGDSSNSTLDTRNNNQILALAILLSSVFIYGPVLGVNDIAVDDVSSILGIGQSTYNTFSALGKFSPMFVLLRKEYNSETMDGEEDATRNTNLEKLRSYILYGINALMKFVSKKVRPKKRGDTIITGPLLACFTKSFSENVNNKVVHNVSSLWQSVEELEVRKARDTATEIYLSSLERLETPVEESMLLEAHIKAVVKALTAFCESSIGNVEIEHKYERELWSFFAKALEDHKRVANIEAYSRCCNAIEEMSKKLWALPYSHDANIDNMIKALDNAVAEYEVSINGPMKWQTLSSFLRKSIQDILVHRRGNQIDELVSENSKLKVQHREMESEMDLLKKQIEGGEKMKKEYQKLYESAIDDMGKISDQFKHRIRDLESKCKSIHDEHSKLMEVLGSTRLEASEWKRKYEETLDENGVRSNSSQVGGVEASIVRSDKLIDWKIKYENVVNEQKAVLEKVAVIEERLKQGSAKEDGLRAEFSRVLDEKEMVINEKAAKLATLEQQLASLRSELVKGKLKVEECCLEAKDLRLEISGLNEKYGSAVSAVELLETETETLKREKDEFEKKCISHLEELGKLGLKLKNAEHEALVGKQVVDSSRIEAETARNNKDKLETSLREKCVETEQAKNRIKELEQVCLKVDNAESEAEEARKNENKLRTSLQEKCVEIERAKNRIEELEKLCLKLDDAENEVEVSRKNENKLQTLLEEKCNEIDQAKSRIEELEKVCSKLKDTETEAATAKQLMSSMKLEMELARSTEKRLKTSLEEKNIEIERAKNMIEELDRQKMELSETLEKRAKQNEKAVTELQRIVNVEKEKNKQEGSSFKVSDEATMRVKRLRVETTTITTCSGSDIAQETEEEEEDMVSQESGKEAMAAMMTPRKCTSTTSTEGGGGGASSSSTGLDYSQYTMKKLRSEIMKHGFGAELVVLKNPRKRELLEVYERCVLRK